MSPASPGGPTAWSSPAAPTSTSHAQQLHTPPSHSTASNVVLGAIAKGGSPLQALDLPIFAYSNIYQTDPVTGAFGSHILSPVNDGFYLFGQNMASDGTYTYYNDGYGGTNRSTSSTRPARWSLRATRPGDTSRGWPT